MTDAEFQQQIAAMQERSNEFNQAIQENAQRKLMMMEQKYGRDLTAMKAKLDKALADIQKILSAHVTGPGHSGTIGNGMMFDPSAADATASKGGYWKSFTDCDGDTVQLFVRNFTAGS